MQYLLLMIALFLSTKSLAACELSIEANDAMQFSKKELVVNKVECLEVKLTLTYKGTLPKNAMKHNWVLTTQADMQSVVEAAFKAASTDFVPPKDKRVLASTKLVTTLETTTVVFGTTKLQVGESYKYFCSFPGHAGLMVGNFIVK